MMSDSRTDRHVVSYDLTLQCGCVLRVARDSRAATGPIRVVETRGDRCAIRTHEAGARLYLWELLPDVSEQPEALGHQDIQWF